MVDYMWLIQSFTVNRRKVNLTKDFTNTDQKVVKGEEDCIKTWGKNVKGTCHGKLKETET